MENNSYHTSDRPLVQALEGMLGWGSIRDWSNLDFEKLGDLIQDKTGVALSATTLKRVLGRLKYESQPSQTTLNALAQFLDHADWRSFVQHSQAQQSRVQRRRSSRRMTWLIPSALILTAIVLFASFVLDDGMVVVADYQFEANKAVSEGVPNSVIFKYDATEAPTDSVFIVQTWDVSRKTWVPKDRHFHSAIYYWPGFFRTKLIVGEQIVKTHDLQITSGGWLALVEQKNKPIYFEQSEVLNEHEVSVNNELFTKYGIDILPEAPRVRFFNQGDLGSLMSDSFIFQTTFRNTHNLGNNSCQFAQVLIQCKDDVMIFPFSAIPCVGDLWLYVAGAGFDSKQSDLSAFGSELSEWTTLRVESVDRKITIWVNDRMAKRFQFPHPATGIVGVQYRFSGAAGIKEAWFRHQDRTWDLFSDDGKITADL